MFIKELRERLNLTQSEFAKNLNINQAIVSRYENKKLRPTSEFIIRLIKTFNANPNFIFFGKEPCLNENTYKNEISQELNQLIDELSLYENEKNIISELENSALEKIISLVSDKEIWGKLFSLLFKIDRKLYTITLFICRVSKRLKEKSETHKTYLASIINSFDDKDFSKLNECMKMDLITLFNEKFTEEESNIIIEDCLVVFKHIEKTAPIHKMIELGKN
ncbi:TPA: helix-turn-helix transcriptional regulator [Campylobacter coli]|nr:helix-turn-helix transcriptional regulator [Campylobacter coli]